MPERPNLEFLLNKTPEEMISWFREKGYAVSWNWRDVWKHQHRQAFTVAKATDMDILVSIREEVEKAIEDGTTLREFRKNLEPTLKKKGWWGKQTVVDETTGEIIEVQLGSPWRLKTIYRTNLQTNYMRGRYQHQVKVTGRRPWWMYDAVDDSNTRPSHDANDNEVRRHDDPWWDTHYPPNDWGCRCGVRTLSDRQLESRGLSPATGPGEDFAGEGWDYNPGEESFEPDLSDYPEDIAEEFRKVRERYTPVDTTGDG